MIRREEKIRSKTALTVYDDDGSITGFDGYTDAGESLRVWYEPFGGLFFNGNSGGQERQRNAIQWQRWVIERFEELYSKVTAKPKAISPLKGARGRVQCAQLPQRWNEIAGGISYPARNNGWMRGPQVMGSSYIAPGTVVATFLGQDYYPNRSGGNHVGIFVSGTAEGFYIIEQYHNRQGGVIGHRFIRASPVRAGDYSDYFSNANQYSVVMIPTPAPPGCNCGDSCKTQ
jgi:hypothetical protein